MVVYSIQRQEDIHLEGQVDENRALKQEIERLRGDIDVTKHDKAELLKRMGAMLGDFKEMEETLQITEELNSALIYKERRSNDELQEARKHLIDVTSLTSFLPSFQVSETFRT